MPRGIRNTMPVLEVEEKQEVAQKPVVEVKSRLVTVLWGYGKERHDHVHKLDHTVFVGGVARNVPRTIAEAWKNGLRPEGTTKPYAMDGKESYTPAGLDVIILENDATEADFVRATGYKPMQASKFAALLRAYPASEIVEALGTERATQLANELRASLNIK